MTKLSRLFLTLIIFFIPLAVNAKENLVNIYFFHSNTCSHCQAEQKFLEKLDNQYPNLKIYEYEIHESNNQKIFEEVAAIYKTSSQSIPLTIIGDKSFTGYNEEKTPLIFHKTITYYSKYGYLDRVANLTANQTLPTYKVDDTQISIDDFLTQYGNHKLIGSITTDNVDVETTTTITSILTELNPINIIIIIVLIILTVNLTYKQRLLTILIYSNSYFLSNLILLINIKFLTIIMYLMYLIILIYLIIQHKKLKRSHIPIIIIILLTVASNTIKYTFLNKYINIYLENITINKLSSLNIIYQYLINTTLTFLVTFLLIVIINILYTKVIRKIFPLKNN